MAMRHRWENDANDASGLVTFVMAEREISKSLEIIVV